MTKVVKKTHSRMARWFKQMTEKNKTPYRWYEVDHCGI